MKPDWKAALRTGYQLAYASIDPSTQNAAFLAHTNGQPVFGTTAWNRFPNGILHHADRWERPVKYSYVEHAERGCIYEAAKHGIPTKGATMVCPWAACPDCARGIICSGISRLVRHQVEDSAHWADAIAVADQMLAEAGVEVITIYGSLHTDLQVRRNGVLFTP